MATSPPASRSASPSMSPSRQNSVGITRIRRSNSSTAWSLQEDHQLLAHRASGLNWHIIAIDHFPSKTANACRKRHERLISRRNADSWDGKARLELLAREYMLVRQEMWETLAARVGERWNVVEMKCMQQGLKNLTNAARSRKRKRSISLSEEGNTTTSMLDDSAIVVSDDESKEEAVAVSKEIQNEDSLTRIESVEAPAVLPAGNTIQPCQHSPHRSLISKPSPPRSRSSRLPTIASMLRSPSPSPQVDESRSFRESTAIVSTFRRA